MKAVLLLLVISSLGGAFAFAQTPSSKGGGGKELLGSNAEGTHFFVGFMQNEVRCAGASAGSPQQRLSIASRFAATVTLSAPDGTGLTLALKPFQIQSVDVDMSLECLDEGVYRKGIEVTSTEPISMYVYSSKQQTSDGYLALPVSSWGTEYITANYLVDAYDSDPMHDPFGCNDLPRGGEFAVLAAEDNTQIAIYPKTRTLTGATGVINKILNKGDIWQIQDGGQLRGGTDLTGSVVVATKPVGLLSGHVRAAVPFIYSSKNHLIEMLPPRNALGKRHIAVPFYGRQGGDMIRVIASDAGVTNISFANGVSNYDRTINNVGGYVDFDLQQVTVINADKPVLVTQYSRSAGADPRNRQGSGVPPINFDPYMVVVTPEEQFVNGAIFHTLPNLYGRMQQYDHHYVTVVGERAKFSTITLDDIPLASHQGYVSGLVSNTPYAWATMEVSDGVSHVLSGDALFGGYVYGLGSFDAYGWPIGAGLRKFDQTDNHPPTLSAVQDCGGYTVTASDAGNAELGLLSVTLDSAWSQNVKLEHGMMIVGDETVTARVTVLDPRQPGRARVIAKDLAGNLDTLDLILDPAAPLHFSEDLIEVRNVVLKQTYRHSFFVKNPNKDPMSLDSIVCVRRKEFLLDANYTGKVIAPGDSFEVVVLFATSVRGTFRDTLVIKSLCQYYRIPMVATMGMPGIITEDRDYGKVRVGRDSCMDVHVRSNGAVPLRLDSCRLEGDGFVITIPWAGPLVLEPGADTIVHVCFQPSVTGDFKGTVRFFSDADSIATANLHGIGVYPKLAVGGYDFGNRQVGDDSCSVVPVVNTGDDTAHVTGLKITGPAGFTVDPSAFPHNLAHGDTLWVTVCFKPTAEHGYGVDISAQNLDGLEAGDSLKGTAYELRASISGADWKRRWLFSKNDSLVYIRNRSTEPLRIDSVQIVAGDIGDFKTEPLLAYPMMIPPGDSLPVPVQFSPLLAGFRSSIIRAWTSSRINPVIDSVLQGFGLMAMSSDTLEFDSSVAFSCAIRYGKVTIYNDGNTPLTLDEINLVANPDLVFWSAPVVGQRIEEGDSLVINFNVELGGYSGTLSGDIFWRFKEMPDSIIRHFSMTSRPQQYAILASAPEKVALGKEFNLGVKVDGVVWRQLPRTGATLRVEYNPTVARFDVDRWKAMTDTCKADWRPVGEPKIERPGVVLVRFEPGTGDPRVAKPLPLDSVEFIALPFRSFLGNNDRDTLRVTMTSEDSLCAPPCTAMAPYVLDSLCGITTRIFEFTGAPYALKQNTPNPSGDATTIEFTLGMDAPTVLELFATDGRLVKRLAEGPMAAGTYSIDVNTRELPSGLYYYRLTSGPYGAVRQMVVTK
jgi:hypothetical protein